MGECSQKIELEAWHSWRLFQQLLAIVQRHWRLRKCVAFIMFTKTPRSRTQVFGRAERDLCKLLLTVSPNSHIQFDIQNTTGLDV